MNSPRRRCLGPEAADGVAGAAPHVGWPASEDPADTAKSAPESMAPRSAEGQGIHRTRCCLGAVRHAGPSRSSPSPRTTRRARRGQRRRGSWTYANIARQGRELGRHRSLDAIPRPWHRRRRAKSSVPGCSMSRVAARRQADEIPRRPTATCGFTWRSAASRRNGAGGADRSRRRRYCTGDGRHGAGGPSSR